MASIGFGKVAPAAASPAGWRLSSRRAAAQPSTARVPAATKAVVAKAEEKGLFDTIFGALYKEEQLLETDPILNKVEGKAAAAAPARKAGTVGKKAAAGDDGGNGGFSFGGLFSKKE